MLYIVFLLQFEIYPTSKLGKYQYQHFVYTFVLVGFSSWLMIPIRANANTVINENSPADARSLLAYYNLEQYPETHLFYGLFFLIYMQDRMRLNPT